MAAIALLENVLNLKRRKDLKVLNNPKDTTAYNAAMKASNALLGAQGHHLFDQQELIRAFAGRSPEFYFRVIKKLAKKGIIVNDNAKQIIPAWGDQTKGTVHSKIHEQLRGLPKTDYSQLTERQLVSQLTKQALARKRIAASTITATIQGLKKADPTFSALPAQYIARWIKENPKEFHKLTKDVPIPIPTDERWPIGKGGPGTISIEGKRNADLRRILGIGKGAGANAQYFANLPAAEFIRRSFFNPQSAEAASSMLATGANKEDTAKFFKGIGNDLQGQAIFAALSKMLNGNGLANGIGKNIAPLLIGMQGKQIGDAILKGAVGEDLKSQGEVTEAAKKLKKALKISNGKSDRQNWRHGTGVKINRQDIDDYNMTNGKNDDEFYENYMFNKLAIKKDKKKRKTT
tara:strand:- start:215 stop:1429 length:1215 start_codon:yes stop_codon:yes gene_type:complete